MSELVVFVAIVAAMAGVGLALGIIVAGRMDRLMASRTAEPPTTPTTPTAATAPEDATTPAEPPDTAEPPRAPAPSQEDQS